MTEKELLIKYAGAMETITDRLKSIMEEVEDLRNDLLEEKSDCEKRLEDL